MDENKIFYIIPRENFFEIVLKAELSEEELFNEINFIISGGNYYKSMSVNQLWSTKLNDNIYKFEIQLNIDESDKEKFILFVNSMNYSQIEL